MPLRLRDVRLREVLKFLVGGGSAILVDFVTYRLMMKFGVGMSFAKGVSYVLGAAVGFVINKFWTFESNRKSLGEVARYIILYSCSALVNAGVNKTVMVLFDVYILAFLCATGVSTVMNFLGQKFFVFRKNNKKEENVGI